MPSAAVSFYQEGPGEVPVFDWLQELRRQDLRAYAKCLVQIRRLAESGYALQRPAAAPLGGGLYELRMRHGRVHYRILYFFHANAAVLAHALTKEGAVPQADIDRARRRRRAFEHDPEGHTHAEAEDEA